MIDTSLKPSDAFQIRVSAKAPKGPKTREWGATKPEPVNVVGHLFLDSRRWDVIAGASALVEGTMNDLCSMIGVIRARQTDSANSANMGCAGHPRFLHPAMLGPCCLC